MDGPVFRVPRPLVRALAAASLLLALATAGASFAGAAEQDPSERWPSDGVALRTAVSIAADYWGMDPCHGAVEIGWLDGLGVGVAAESTWANDVGPYAAPVRNTSCEVALNPGEQWTWPRLCTVIVHEIGHLDGHDHVDDPRDVMHAAVLITLPACADAPEPAPPAPAIHATTPPKPAAPKPAAPRAPRHATAAKHHPAHARPRSRGRRARGRRS